MANHTGYEDAYVLMNAVAKQALGLADISVHDTSSFVSVGEMVLRTGTESVMNAISQVMGSSVVAVRPYTGKLRSMYVDDMRYAERRRKLTPLYKELEQDGAYNTPTRTNIANGQTVDHYVQNLPEFIELSFYGSEVCEKSITRLEDQISNAFRNEAEFLAFWSGVMTEIGNEIEILNESKRRATLCNYIGGISSMGLTEVDLVAEFNTENNTQYTREQLLSLDHITEFAKFMATTIKVYSDRLTDLSANHHANITGKSKILRHTPKSAQRMIMYGPVFTKLKTEVYSTIFNPEYLNIGEMELVNFWQSQNDPTEISVKPNILDVSNGQSKTATAQVDLPYVLGLLFDRDALGVTNKYERVATTPLNAKGLYTNTFWHWRFMPYVDYTENAVLFVLGAGGE